MKHLTKTFSMLMIVSMAFAALPVGGVLAQTPLPDTLPPLVTVSLSSASINLGQPVTVTAMVDDSTTGGSNILSAEYSLNGGTYAPMTPVDVLDSPTESFTAVVTPTTGGTANVCVKGSDVVPNVSVPVCTTVSVKQYEFKGFLPPLKDKGKAVNSAKAGRTIPVKFQVTDLTGGTVKAKAAFNGLFTYAVDCTSLTGDATLAVKEKSAGKTALRYAGKFFILNWKTPKAYARTCRVMYVQLSDGTQSTPMVFQFK